jgi:putative ABC transport system permease protein
MSICLITPSCGGAAKSGFAPLAGLALGMGAVRFLFFQVKPTDLGVLALPSVTILAAALLAALPAVIHAVRIDPVIMLKAE